MNKSDFLKEQYLSLREEIKETKSRKFAIMGLALAVGPGIQYVNSVGVPAIQQLILFSPLLVVIIGLIYLAENNALMRCGAYIKENIEKPFPDVCGWEQWLEKHDGFSKSNWYKIHKPSGSRSVDIYLALAFHILFLVYYIFSTALAIDFAYTAKTTPPWAILTWLYIPFGLIAGATFLANIKFNTTSIKICEDNP